LLRTGADGRAVGGVYSAYSGAERVCVGRISVREVARSVAVIAGARGRVRVRCWRRVRRTFPRPWAQI